MKIALTFRDGGYQGVPIIRCARGWAARLPFPTAVSTRVWGLKRSTLNLCGAFGEHRPTFRMTAREEGHARVRVPQSHYRPSQAKTAQVRLCSHSLEKRIVYFCFTRIAPMDAKGRYQSVLSCQFVQFVSKKQTDPNQKMKSTVDLGCEPAGCRWRIRPTFYGRRSAHACAGLTHLTIWRFPWRRICYSASCARRFIPAALIP
jgi:hypothetical protein